MNRRRKHLAIIRFFASLTLGSALLTGACSSADGKSSERAAPAVVAVSATPVAATEQAIARFVRATGTLMAEEQADVAAETAGRVVATPIERGTAVRQGTELIRLSPTETESQVNEA